MPETSRSILIDAPQAAVFEVISDVGAYPEFVPNMEKVDIERKSKKEISATFTLAMLMKIRYTLDMALNPPRGLKWVMSKGDMMRTNTGAWELEELSETKTRATYSIDVTFGPFVPQKIVSMLIESSLPATLTAFKKRAESLAKPPKPKRGAGK